jgi:hypothetical protein
VSAGLEVSCRIPLSIAKPVQIKGIFAWDSPP